MESVLRDKSYLFALRIVRLHKYLIIQHKEYTLSKQILRSGTSVGALVREAQFAQSVKDFINKLSIALKEANETEYWIILLKDSELITKKMYENIQPDVIELKKILTASINTAKKKLKP
ncbi:MAG: four helix bundle protein [Thiotrichaceae bacterium]|nr:MAG: four helix bundle protein [Thiotrichaceae bacterium]